MSSEENDRKRQRPAEEIGEKRRRPFSRSHKIERDETGKHHMLLLLTGSFEVTKIPRLLAEIFRKCGSDRVLIKAVATEKAAKLCEISKLEFGDVIVYEGRDEWSMLRKKGDSVLHIELQSWADSVLIAPLDDNTMAKLANGISDNLVTSIIYGWDFTKPCFFAPAMDMDMWENPMTIQHRNTLKSVLKFKEICPTTEVEGHGAMAPVETISSLVAAMVRDQLAVRSRN